MIIVCDDVKLTNYCNNKHSYDVLVISILNFKEVIKTTLIIYYNYLFSKNTTHTHMFITKDTLTINQHNKIEMFNV